jgi:hypothetical protein
LGQDESLAHVATVLALDQPVLAVIGQIEVVATGMKAERFKHSGPVKA